MGVGREVFEDLLVVIRVVVTEEVMELVTNTATELLLEEVAITLVAVLLVLASPPMVDFELTDELDPGDGYQAEPRTFALIETPLVLPPDENK